MTDVIAPIAKKASRPIVTHGVTAVVALVLGLLGGLFHADLGFLQKPVEAVATPVVQSVTDSAIDVAVPAAEKSIEKVLTPAPKADAGPVAAKK
jgi:hypothetical protein